MPNTSYQREAWFALLPENNVTNSNMNDTGNRNMGTALNMRHGTLWTMITNTVPAAKKQACLMSGFQKLPLL